MIGAAPPKLPAETVPRPGAFLSVASRAKGGELAWRWGLEIGIPVLALLGLRGVSQALAGENRVVITFWFGLVAITSLLPLPLPVLRRGELLSPAAAAPVFAMGLLYGPGPAASAGLMSGVVSGFISSVLPRLEPGRRSARLKAGLSTAAHLSPRLGLAAAAGGHSFLLAGGYAYPGLANSLFEITASDAWPVVLAMCGFFGVYMGTGILFVAVNEGLTPGRVLRGNYRGMTLGPASFLILGFLMAVVALRVGVGWTCLLVPALLVTRGSIQLRLDLQRARASAIRALTSAIDARDAYTRGHSERVARYAVRVARHLDLPESTVEALEVAALLHDLGKVTIDPEVLGRPQFLTAEEQKVMHTHAEVGARVMSELAYLARHADMVRCHHERPDGQGYPRGLQRDEIPLGARIIKVLDALDAMTSDRPYRRALPLNEALAELARGAGKQFDEKVVRLVTELVRQGEISPA